MKPETGEWVDRASGDLRVAERELASADPVLHVVCFLAQQAGEKYLKALMEERSIPPRKTHDLMVLLDLLPDLSTMLEMGMRERIAELSTMGVQARYPGMGTDRDSAERSVETSRYLRALVERLL